MVFEVYDALKEAGASDEKAAKAAKVLADYDSRFNKIAAELAVMKWMVVFNLAFTMAMLWKIFS